MTEASHSRREYLAALGSVGVVTIAGCNSGQSNDDEPEESETPEGPQSSVGRSFDLSSGATVTLNAAYTANSIAGETGYATTPEDKQFLFVEMEARNNGDEVAQLPGVSDIVVDVGEARYQRASILETTSPSQPVNKSRYQEGGRTDPGGSVAGVIAFPIPVSEQTPVLTIAGAETNTGEPRWELPRDAIDSINLNPRMEVPDEITQGEETVGSLVVENTGSRVGQFYRVGGYQQEDIQLTVQAGSEASYDHTFYATQSPSTLRWSVGQEYNRPEAGLSVEVAVVPPEFSVGETWSLAEVPLEVTLTEAQITDSVTVVQESFYDSETVTLSDAESYVVFSVDLNSTSGDSFEAPWAYLVSAGDVSVDSQFADYDAVVEPIEGEQLSGGFTDRATAYYVLRTGADISREDVKIRLEHTPGFSNEGPAADYRLE